MVRWLAGSVSALVIACAAAAAADPPPGGDGTSVAPSGADLVAVWNERAFGFDSLEAYEVVYDTGRTEFMIARRWVEDGAQILVDLEYPPAIRRAAMLLLPLPDGGSVGFSFFPSGRNSSGRNQTVVRRISGRGSWLGIPLAQRRGASGPAPRIPSGTLVPLPLHAMEHERLAEEEVAGEACWIVESRLRDDRRDRRVRFAFSKTSGIALRARYFERGSAPIEVRISPEDVETYDDWLSPVRREIASAEGGWKAEVIRRNLLMHPALPARMFTTHNLKVQHFPRF